MPEQQHGGARPKRRADDKRGGPRPGAGGLVKSVALSTEDWRTLRIILLARGGRADKAAVSAFFAGIIRQAWQIYDEEE